MSDIRQLSSNEIDCVSGGETMNPTIRRMGQSASMGAQPPEPDYVVLGVGALDLLIWFW
jgi:hypothetical protein